MASLAFPIIYLGLTLTLGQPKLVHVQSILDKARSRLAGWQGRLLNPAGRHELVRSILSAVPVYLLTSFKAPKQLIQDLDKVRRLFLSDGDAASPGANARWDGQWWRGRSSMVVWEFWTWKNLPELCD